VRSPDLPAAVVATRRVRDLPGPRGLPLIGNVFQFERPRMHVTLEGWRQAYGDYYRFRNGPREMVVIADPEAIGAVLRDRPDGFARTARLAAIAREMGFEGVFTAEGDVWRRQRGMVMHGLDPAHIKAYWPTLVRVTQRFAGRWQRAAAAGAAIDLQADLMRYTVDVTSGLAFGIDMNTIESDEEVIQQHLDKVFPALFRKLMSPFPRWKWLRTREDRRLEYHLEELRRAVNGFIAQARARMDPAHPTNLIESMIAARDSAGGGMDDQEIAGNVFTLLLAGEDTTANTLAWMIWLLFQNPAALERARAEVASIEMKYEQVAALPFVEACANETMRLKPVAPLIILEALRDTVVAGIEIPAGQLVLLLMRPPAVDEKYFPDPKAFDPARWLDPNTRNLSSAKRVSMPFGAGPRLCPGRYLAMLEMKMVIAMLLGGFELESVATADAAEPRELMAFTMAPVGLQLRLKNR